MTDPAADRAARLAALRASRGQRSADPTATQAPAAPQPSPAPVPAREVPADTRQPSALGDPTLEMPSRPAGTVEMTHSSMPRSLSRRRAPALASRIGAAGASTAAFLIAIRLMAGAANQATPPPSAPAAAVSSPTAANAAATSSDSAAAAGLAPSPTEWPLIVVRVVPRPDEPATPAPPRPAAPIAAAPPSAAPPSAAAPAVTAPPPLPTCEGSPCA